MGYFRARRILADHDIHPEVSVPEMSHLHAEEVVRLAQSIHHMFADRGSQVRMLFCFRARALPIFLFHEGGSPIAANAFRQMARLSRGAYLRFDTGSADRLKDLLGAIAVYAAGGYRALAAYGERKGGEVLRLTTQLQG